MRVPRILALLLVLASVLALGAWFLLRVVPAVPPAPRLEDAAPPAAADSTPLDAPEEPSRERVGVVRAGAPLPLAQAPVPGHGSRIVGRVVRGSARTPVAGAKVRCVEWNDTGDGWRLPRGVELERPGAARVRPVEPARGTSGADGRFEFEGLDPRLRYELTADAGGSSVAAELHGLAPSEEEVLLVVRTLYVAELVALDEQGRRIESDQLEFLRYAREPQPGDCAADELRQRTPEFSDADFQITRGTPAERPLPSASDCRYRFASDCDAPRLGPFQVLVCCPGYRRQDFEFWAWPAGVGAPPTALRLAHATQAGLVLVRQTCPCKSGACAHLVEGTLLLEPLEGEGGVLTRSLGGLAREEVFAELPRGRFRARVWAKFGGFCFPPADEPGAELTIGEARAVLELPVETLGALRWQIRGPDDRIVAEPARILSPADRARKEPSRLPLRSDGTADLQLAVVMRGLAAGPQVFRIEHAEVESVDGAEWTPVSGGCEVRVDVRAGELRTIVVHAR